MSDTVLRIGLQVGGYAIGGPFGAMLGSIAGAALFPGELPNVYGPRLEDGKVTSSAYGQPVPRVWGQVSIAGNVIDASEVREVASTRDVGGKSAPSQEVTSYSYNADIAVMICEGEIDGLVQIYANEVLIYDATPGAAAVQPDWLSFTLYTGSETQEPDPTLEAIHGAGNVPAYRGVAYIVFRQYQLQGQSTAVNFRFVVARSTSQDLRETQIAMPGNSRHIGYSPRADVIFIPQRYASAQPANEPTPVLYGIEPYSRSIVWTGTVEDGDDYYLFGDAALCIHPSYLIKPSLVNTAIAVAADGGIAASKIQLFDAITGQSIARYAAPDTATDTGFAFFYAGRLELCKFQTFESGDPALYQWTLGASSFDKSIDPPDGYDWNANNPPVSNGAGHVVATITNSTTSTPALAVIDNTSTGQTAVATAVALPANSLAPTGAAWDDTSQCWWLIGNTTGLTPDRPRVYKLQIDGTLTASDLYLLYSISDQIDGAYSSPKVWLDEIDGVLWWQASSGAAYAWNPITQEAPKVYAGGTNTGGVVYHRGTRTVWGAQERTNGSPYYDGFGFHVAGIEGAAETLQQIVDDLCDGTEIQSGDKDTDDLAGVLVSGFSISRDMSRRDAIEALRNTYLFDIVPRSGVLTGLLRGASSTSTLDEDDIGAHIAGSSAPDAPIKISKAAEAALPRQMDVTYLSAAQNYEPATQTSRRLASSGGTTGRMQAPVVLTEDEGAQLSDVLLHLSHIAAETYEFTAMPSQADNCQPGKVVTVTHDGESYTLRITSAGIIDGRIVAVQGHRDDVSIYESFSVGGSMRTRSRTVAAVGTTIFWLLDIPALRSGDGDAGAYVAAGSYTPGWPGGVLYQSSDGQSYTEIVTLNTHARLGAVRPGTVADSGRKWDMLTSLSVLPINSTFASSAWESAITAGNLAAWGAAGRWEIVAFTTATLESDGSWTISGMARGLLDTVQYADDHQSGDLFIVLNEDAITKIRWTADQYSVEREIKAVTFGKSLAETVSSVFTPGGGALIPFAPCRLHGSLSGTTWTLSWMRQDRAITRAFQQPAQSESTEAYKVRILDSLGTVLSTRDATTSSFSYTSAMQVEDYGDDADVVRFQVAQVSAVVGVGNWSSVCVVGFDPKLEDTSGTGTAVSSGNYIGAQATAAFDNNATSYWQSNTNIASNPWVGVQYGTAQKVRQVTISQNQNIGASFGYASTATVDYSDDGSSWTTLDTITLAQNTSVQAFDMPLEPEHAYWRIRATAAANTLLRWAVYEIQFMSPVT